jgi:hypothetical protein
MTFNIGSQTAGVINNVQGDQRITGGQHGVLVTTADAIQALGDLRQGLAAAKLNQAIAAKAQAQLTEMDAAMRHPEPDRPRFARALERLTRMIVATGSVAMAAAPLIGPLQALAAWLGALGKPILRLLPMVG